MRRFLLIAGVLILLGAIGFAVFASIVGEVEEAPAEEVTERFAEAREAAGEAPPMFRRDSAGHWVRDTTVRSGDARAKMLSAFLYRSGTGQLVRTDLPIWFLWIKEPAARRVLRELHVDLDEYGLTVADLRRHGPGIVIERTLPGGDSLLVWLE